MGDVKLANSAAEIAFEDLVRGYLEDYELHGYRAIKSARSRVAQLRRRFAGVAAMEITSGAFGSTVGAPAGGGRDRHDQSRDVSSQPYVSAGDSVWA